MYVYKQCVTEQSARRQREMEAGLLEAMRTKPYDDITISDLCASMNIPRKSFYRYFDSKEDALHALMDHIIMDFSGEVFADEETATMHTLERFFQFWIDRRDFLDALNRSDFGAALVQRCIGKAMEEGTLAKNFLPSSQVDTREYMVSFLISGLMSMVLQWHKTGFNTNAYQMAQLSAQLITKPLLSVSWTMNK